VQLFPNDEQPFHNPVRQGLQTRHRSSEAAAHQQRKNRPDHICLGGLFFALERFRCLPMYHTGGLPHRASMLVQLEVNGLEARFLGTNPTGER